MNQALLPIHKANIQEIKTERHLTMSPSKNEHSLYHKSDERSDLWGGHTKNKKLNKA